MNVPREYGRDAREAWARLVAEVEAEARRSGRHRARAAVVATGLGAGFIGAMGVVPWWAWPVLAGASGASFVLAYKAAGATRG